MSHADEPFHPKAPTPRPNMRRINGVYQNIAEYTQFGGFGGRSKAPEPNRPLTLEGEDLVRKNEPI